MVAAHQRDITAPIAEHDTWAECRACGRAWQVARQAGVLHFYVDTCAECERLMRAASTQVVPRP